MELFTPIIIEGPAYMQYQKVEQQADSDPLSATVRANASINHPTGRAEACAAINLPLICRRLERRRTLRRSSCHSGRRTQWRAAQQHQDGAVNSQRALMQSRSSTLYSETEARSVAFSRSKRVRRLQIAKPAPSPSGSGQASYHVSLEASVSSGNTHVSRELLAGN